MATPRWDVLTFGLESSRDELGGEFQVLVAADTDDVRRHVEAGEAAVLVIGPGLRAEAARNLVGGLAADFPRSTTLNVVLAAGPKPELFQELVDTDRVFYLARDPLPGPQLRAIVAAAVRRFQASAGGGATDALTRADERVLDFGVRLCLQPDIESAGRLLAEAFRSCLGAEAAQCWVYDPAREVLRPVDSSEGDVRTEESPAAGLVGFVARTGQSIVLERVGADPRYDAEADNPGGDREARFLAKPLAETGGTPLAVTTAVRGRHAPAFSAQDVEAADILVFSAAAVMGVASRHARMQALLLERSGAVRGDAEIYRQEALDHHSRRGNQEGDLLAITPWLQRVQWPLALLFLAALAFVSTVNIHDTASGPAVVRARRNVAVHAPGAGTVQSVDVAVGDRVEAGDVLARVIAPGQQRATSFTLKAPTDGIVSDLLLHVDQRLAAGDTAAQITDARAGYELVASLPAAHASLLRPGMRLVLRPQGHPSANVSAAISRVGAAVAAREAARYVHAEDSAAPHAPGSAVVVHGSLPGATFEGQGGPQPYHDGLLGEAEVTIGSQPLVVALVPGLKALWARMR